MIFRRRLLADRIFPDFWLGDFWRGDFCQVEFSHFEFCQTIFGKATFGTDFWQTIFGTQSGKSRLESTKKMSDAVVLAGMCPKSPAKNRLAKIRVPKFVCQKIFGEKSFAKDRLPKIF